MIESSPNPKRYTGGCHCGRVRYRVQVDLSAGTGRCNCSICWKTANWSAMVKPAAFELLQGEEALTDYSFNTGQAHHVFCKVCGVRSFGYGNVPEVGGAYYAVQVRCLDDAEADLVDVPIRCTDGRANTWAPIAVIP